jgi:hypothetical protein
MRGVRDVRTKHERELTSAKVVLTTEEVAATETLELPSASTVK